MQTTWRRSAHVVTVALVLALPACGQHEVKIPAEGATAAPTFQPHVNDLATSPMLKVLRPRDTAGLDPTVDSVDGSVLPAALAALQQEPDAPTELSQVYIYDDYVGIQFEDQGITGRARSGSYRAGDGWSFSDPSYDASPTFPLADVDPDVPQQLIDAIESRVPNARVTRLSIDLDASSPNEVAWRIDVEDAIGTLATVSAELDGQIFAVDLA